MGAENKFIKNGFMCDANNIKLKEVFKNNIKLKDLHIDIYSDNPLNSHMLFMLLLRLSEKNVTVINDNERLILEKSDINKTHIMNVLFSKVIECLYRIYENYTEFILKIQNTYYLITIAN